MRMIDAIVLLSLMLVAATLIGGCSSYRLSFNGIEKEQKQYSCFPGNVCIYER